MERIINPFQRPANRVSYFDPRAEEVSKKIKQLSVQYYVINLFGGPRIGKTEFLFQAVPHAFFTEASVESLGDKNSILQVSDDTQFETFLNKNEISNQNLTHNPTCILDEVNSEMLRSHKSNEYKHSLTECVKFLASKGLLVVLISHSSLKNQLEPQLVYPIEFPSLTNNQALELLLHYQKDCKKILSDEEIQIVVSSWLDGTSEYYNRDAYGLVKGSINALFVIASYAWRDVHQTSKI